MFLVSVRVVMRQNPKTRQHETADFEGAKDMPKVGMKSTIVTLPVVPQMKQKYRAMLRYRDRKNIINSAKGGWLKKESEENSGI
jgi:hypothetical protein